MAWTFSLHARSSLTKSCSVQLNPDAVWNDLRVIEVNDNKWYDDAVTSKASWRALYRDSLESSKRASTEDLSIPSNVRVVCEQWRRTCNR